MTAQGSPITRLRRAIAGGSLAAVDMALYDEPQLDLQDALEVIALMAEAGDPRTARWADRWAARIALEERDRLAALLHTLPDEEALGVLRSRAEELRQVHPAVRIIDRPGARTRPA